MEAKACASGIGSDLGPAESKLCREQDSKREQSWNTGFSSETLRPKRDLNFISASHFASTEIRVQSDWWDAEGAHKVTWQLRKKEYGRIMVLAMVYDGAQDVHVATS